MTKEKLIEHLEQRMAAMRITATRTKNERIRDIYDEDITDLMNFITTLKTGQIDLEQIIKSAGEKKPK